MYVMDYGAPVGYRLALQHPERVSALVVQNGNAYEEGLKAFWDPIKAYWADGSQAHREALGVLVAPATTKFQYTDGVSDVSRIDPDNWRARSGAARPPRQPGHPARPVPRLRHQRPALSAIPGVLPRTPAADADRLGQERQDLPRRRRRALSARPAQGRAPSARHRPFRARGQARRHGADDPRFPRPHNRDDGQRRRVQPLKPLLARAAQARARGHSRHGAAARRPPHAQRARARRDRSAGEIHCIPITHPVLTITPVAS